MKTVSQTKDEQHTQFRMRLVRNDKQYEFIWSSSGPRNPRTRGFWWLSRAFLNWLIGAAGCALVGYFVYSWLKGVAP